MLESLYMRGLKDVHLARPIVCEPDNKDKPQHFYGKKKCKYHFLSYNLSLIIFSGCQNHDLT